MTDLKDLAASFVALTGELEDLRRQTLSALTNGAGAGPPAGPTGARRLVTPGKEKTEKAAEAETAIVEILKTETLGPSELARRTEAKIATVNDRLRRLASRGLQRDEAARPRPRREEERDLLKPGLPIAASRWVLPLAPPGFQWPRSR
jgi:hypothetical protein